MAQALLQPEPLNNTQDLEQISRPDPKPFLKWAGGKRQSLPTLLAHAPNSFGSYFEPMLGAGALFFALRRYHLEPNFKAHLNDINGELINAFHVVQNRVESLILALKEHQHKHCERYFYKIRDADRSTAYWTWSEVEKAARFIYLNKTCYNGLYRVNSRGEFNVPFGDYKAPAIVDDKTLRECAEALKGVTLSRVGFRDAADRAQKGDFVYFDPPYEPVSSSANFTQYAKGGFTAEDQTMLRNTFLDLNRRGVFLLLSNSAAPLIYDLYKDFEIVEVDVARAINSKGALRGKVKELLVKNY